MINIRKAAQTDQISFKADSRNVRHADLFYTAGIISVWVFGNQQGRLSILGSPGRTSVEDERDLLKS